MTQNENEKEPWPGHDEAIVELQKWADAIPGLLDGPDLEFKFVENSKPIRGWRSDAIIFDDHQMPDGTLFLGSEAEAANLKAIYEGLGIPKEIKGGHA